MSPPMRLLLVVGVVVAFAIPVIAAVHLARLQAAQVEARYALDLARSAIVQIEKTGDQLAAAARTLNALSADEACAPNGLDIMRRIDLESTLLQGVGWVEGDVLRCSSFYGDRPVRMGPPTYISSNRAVFRTKVPIIDPQRPYVIVQSGAAAGVVHPDLALSFVPYQPGLALVGFSWSRRIPVLQRGDWTSELLSGDLRPGARRQPDGTTLAVVRSGRTDMGALVVVPHQHTMGVARQVARQLIPAGLLSGTIMAMLFFLAARNRASMRGMIRSALARGLFYLVYQPIVSLESGKVVGVEALLRWNRERGAEISPDIFIAVAEQRGLMPALTARVFELLEQDLPTLLAVDPELELAVNLTAPDLHNPDLPRSMRDFAAKVGISPARIVIEATERGLLDPGRAGPSLAALRDSGVRIAIDDFGTGYSSLAYLAVLEVDILKIDKLFIQALGTQSATSQVAQGVIEMARVLDLATIAEGIETAEQEHIVRGLGVGQAQGYHYARPLPLDQMVAYLRERVASN
jgi:sensor c-di-GMP phosphodiesterase-like protein